MTNCDTCRQLQAATQHSAARIAELEAQANVCGGGAGCLYKEARIEALEAEVQALRRALQFAVDEQFGDVPAKFPLSKWIVDAQKVLEGRK